MMPPLSRFSIIFADTLIFFVFADFAMPLHLLPDY